MEFLTDLLDNSTVPWITAILLGLLTAISPCPLATNITAIGFISKDVEDRKRVFYNGLFFTAGKAITYTGLALIIILGADQLRFSGFLQKYGEKIIGPVLVIIGLLMLDLINIRIGLWDRLSGGMQKKKKWHYLDAVLLGLVLALAFCPYSGVLYFGMLIPLSLSSSSGLFLPLIFAVATALPVIILAWLIAYMVGALSIFYNRIRVFELWFRRIAAVLFIIIGLYYIIRIYLIKA
jgi:cytochrome c biogenesis protein CcdA